MADELRQELGGEYTISSLRKENQGGENAVRGKYYDKVVDVDIAKDANSVGIVSIKFVTSNFKQNANNYFEHLMGETANLRRNGIIFGHLMVIPKIVPYLKRNGEIAREEVIGAHHLRKYVNLAQDDDYPHKPDAIGIGLIALPMQNLQNTEEIELANVASMDLDATIATALQNELSVSGFVRKMKTLVTAKNARI